MTMYAIAFDMKTDSLKTEYGDPYNGAYQEIESILSRHDFTRLQGSLYATSTAKNQLARTFSAIEELKSTSWFRKSVRDIRVFKIEDWSDFTPQFTDTDK